MTYDVIFDLVSRGGGSVPVVRGDRHTTPPLAFRKISKSVSIIIYKIFEKWAWHPN